MVAVTGITQKCRAVCYDVFVESFIVCRFSFISTNELNLQYHSDNKSQSVSSFHDWERKEAESCGIFLN